MSGTYKYILDFVANNSKFVNAMNQNSGKLTEVSNKADTAKNKIMGMSDGIGKKLASIASFAAISAGATALVTNIVDIRKEFEKYEAVLTNSLGSSQKATEAMKMLQNFATQTPFALTELTGAFVKLTNYGLKPSLNDLKSYGDIASSVGKGFDQLAEALADAVTGEFERLKEFGIKAKQEGDKVTFTFKEQSTTVDNTAASIKNYITGLGNLQGVSGSMAAISETLGGKISNLGDAWDGLMNSMGAQSSGTMVSVIEFLTTAANKTTAFFAGIQSSQGRGSDIIKSILGDLPKDVAASKDKMAVELTDLKDTLFDFENQLAKEKGKSDISTIFFRKEHEERIQSLVREIEAYSFAVKNLQTVYDDEAKSEKEASDKKLKEAAALAAKKTSIGGISDQIKIYNEQLANTNASDKTSILIISQKIQALELQKAAVAGLIAMEQVQGRVKAVSLDIKATKPKGPLAADIALNPKLAVGRTGLAGTFDKDAEQIEAANKRIQKSIDESQSKVQALQGAFESGFTQIGQSVLKGFGLAADGFDGFISGLADTVMKLIAMMLSESIANSIAGATASGAATGPAAIFTTPAFIATAVGGVLAAFASIPAFASGGIAYGPTMGLMGEYPGAASNPEVIAPLSKLKGLIGGGGGGSQQIILQPSIVYDGGQFRVFLNRVNKNVNKRT